MPKYLYKCKKCNIETFFFHSMSEEKEDCEKCGKKKSLEKLPSQFVTNLITPEEQAGDLVKRSIEEFKGDLKEQKEKLSNEFYNSNK